MNGVYRVLTLLGLWLGFLAFVVAVVVVVGRVGVPFDLTRGGILRGAQTLLLIGIGAYCAARVQKG